MIFPRIDWCNLEGHIVVLEPIIGIRPNHAINICHQSSKYLSDASVPSFLLFLSSICIIYYWIEYQCIEVPCCITFLPRVQSNWCVREQLKGGDNSTKNHSPPSLPHFSTTERRMRLSILYSRAIWRFLFLFSWKKLIIVIGPWSWRFRPLQFLHRNKACEPCFASPIKESSTYLITWSFDVFICYIHSFWSSVTTVMIYMTASNATRKSFPCCFP